ncbi:MAG: geranylgeranyl reductase family protein [Candidatus Thorarchaeota archaeon]
MQSSFDVIVVGAGPAGSNAARVVAEHGFSTLLVERRRQVGVPIQCGEYLPTPREQRDMFPRCKRVLRLTNVPKDLIQNRTTHMSLISPKWREYQFKLESNIVDRARFDQFLTNSAVDAGASLMLESRVLNRAVGNILRIRTPTGMKEFRARVVIGADGPRSIIANSIGSAYPNEFRDMSQSLQYFLKGVDFDPTYPLMLFGHRAAPGGYAWMIPTSSSSANLGFGLRRRYMSPDLNLHSFLKYLIRKDPIISKHAANAKIVGTVGASIPVGGPKKQTSRDGVLLAGDAAGHVMASNGGGIPTAMAGGEIAGYTAAEHLSDGSSLSSYEDRWKEEFGSELYRALGILRVADVMMMTDAFTEVAMRLSGSRYLEDVIRCRIPRPISFLSPVVSRLFETL